MSDAHARHVLPQMHIVKNYMSDQLEGVNPPLILGIWGPKGCGKTFQTELALKKLGYVLSAHNGQDCLMICTLPTIVVVTPSFSVQLWSALPYFMRFVQMMCCDT